MLNDVETHRAANLPDSPVKFRKLGSFRALGFDPLSAGLASMDYSSISFESLLDCAPDNRQIFP